MSLGEKIYELRRAKNLSQEELGDILNVSRQTISKWETGETIPEISKLINMCDYFELNLNDFVRDKHLTMKKKTFIEKLNLSTIIVFLLNVLIIIAILISGVPLAESIISITSILIISLIVLLVINNKKTLSKNNNKFSIKSIGIYIAIIILVVLTLGSVIYFINFNQKQILLSEKTYTNIENINATLLSGDIKILSSNNNDILVKVYANKKDTDTILLEEYNYTLIIKQKDKLGNLIVDDKLSLEVFIPSYNDVKFNINSNSGDILSRIKTQGSFSTSSGDIEIDDLFNSNIKTTSGEITLHEAQNIYDIKSNSGKIKINKLTGFDNIVSKSGDIFIKELILKEDSNITSFSGDVKIENYRGIVNAKTNSGNQNINQLKGDYSLNINTTSGNISVNN